MLPPLEDSLLVLLSMLLVESASMMLLLERLWMMLLILERLSEDNADDRDAGIIRKPFGLGAQSETLS